MRITIPASGRLVIISKKIMRTLFLPAISGMARGINIAVFLTYRVKSYHREKKTIHYCLSHVETVRTNEAFIEIFKKTFAAV